MMQDMAGLQVGTMRDDLKRAIIDLGVRFRLMTQFTSFVAVEEDRRTRSASLTTIPVPIEKPEGLSDSMAPAATPVLLAQARAGDPLIRVQAPPDSAQVIALLPGGEIKRLLFDPGRGEWLARFDIPTYAAEGDYFVRVVIVLKDGSRKTLRLRYRVDTTPPKGNGLARLVQPHGLSVPTGARMDGPVYDPNGKAPAGPSPMLRLELDAGEDTARAAALLPWGGAQ